MESKLVAAIHDVPLNRGRRIIAIAGAPASGKSTLAQRLARQINGSCILPMDGFHQSNEWLKSNGLFSRKGAPETFDVANFETVVRDIRKKNTVCLPTFDRDQDRVVPAGGMLEEHHHTIIVEGNYLLLYIEPWTRLHEFWDLTIMLETSSQQLEKRLVQRWLDQGLSAADAQKRAAQNDLPNGHLVEQNSIIADLIVPTT